MRVQIVSENSLKCGMCGQCCRKIHLGRDLRWYSDTDTMFFKRHWHFIGMSDQIDGGFIYNGNSFYVYSCDYVTDDNKCSIHKYNPHVCSGYPFYGKDITVNGNKPWQYPGCTYELLSHRLHILEILYKIIKLKEEEDESKNRKQPEIDYKSSDERILV